jgi:hypothetical protein
LKELDVSSNAWDERYSSTKVDGAGFAQGISKGLSDNGAMRRLDARDNDIDDEGKRALQQG